MPTSAEKRAGVIERLDAPAVSALSEIEPDEDDEPIDGELVD